MYELERNKRNLGGIKWIRTTPGPSGLNVQWLTPFLYSLY